MGSTPFLSQEEREHDKLVQRGHLEEILMAPLQSPIVEDKKTPYIETLRTKGVVRIDQILTNDIADAMYDYVQDLKQQLIQQNSTDRFAKVLLHHHRYDLKLTLGPPPVQATLASLFSLSSPVRHVFQSLLGSNAILYELSCLLSNPGSQRQNIHPDRRQEDPLTYTCFVALSDITITMGPTVWIPTTHTNHHDQFQSIRIMDEWDTESPKDRLLRTKPSVVGILPKGSCVMFDARLLHCGGANSSQQSRALFYISFQQYTTQQSNSGSLVNELRKEFLQFSELCNRCVERDDDVTSPIVPAFSRIP